MNRWHVFEWIKRTFMFSGRVPARELVLSAFQGRSLQSEIELGIVEFEKTTQLTVRSFRRTGWLGDQRWAKLTIGQQKKARESAI